MQERYAYYPGCLASLSQKELDSSTRAIAKKLQIELVDMPSVTCCGAGDIHEAKPDYYLHISARILGQAFDSAILYQAAAERGRADGEVLALLRQGLQGAARTRDIVEVRGEQVRMSRLHAAIAADIQVPAVLRGDHAEVLGLRFRALARAT